VARRLADSVRRTLFSVDPSIRGVTVSIGVTALREADDGLENVLGRIDKAVYRAKALGRDRTEVMP
jgi:diguanylate cyclase (GGDEF)-like protein